MPTFKITGPDGKAYNVTGATPEGAKEALKSSLASQSNLSQLSALTQKPSIAAGAREQYDAMPGWKRAATTLVDLPGLIANGATFGNLDELAAGARSKVQGTNYEDELRKLNQQTENARARQGLVGTGAEILGSIGTGGAASKAVGAGVGYVAPNVARAFTAVAPTASKIKKAINYALRTGMAGAEGAAQGAATAHGEGQDVGEGAVMGGLFGTAAKPLTDLVSTGVSKVAGMFNPKEVVPTLDKINDVKHRLYDISKEAGVTIKPEGMQHLHDTILDDILDKGFDPQSQSGARIMMDRIAKETASGKPLTLEQLDTVRKLSSKFGYQTGPNTDANNMIVDRILGHIDDLTRNADPNIMTGVDTKLGTEALHKAREVAHRGFNLEKAQDLVESGRNQALSNVTDTSIKNVKAKVGQINNPLSNVGRGYNEVEKAAAKEAATYTKPQKALHGLTVLNPLSGGKLSSSLNLGLGVGSFAFGGPLAVAAQQAASGAIGWGAGKLGDYLANKSVKNFLNTVARGGVPAPVVENAVQKMAKSKADAVRRALMAGMNQQYNQPAER